MPISLAEPAEGHVPAMLLRYYATMASSTPQEETRPPVIAGGSRVIREPIGVVAAIVPWNVPQVLTFVKLAPALAAGNAVVLKPAPETVLDAFLVAEAAIEAGLPNGVLNIVPAGRRTSAYLIAHPDVDKIAFTGSTATGRSIAETAGRLLRPVNLELGGKSAAVVLDDADLTASLEDFFDATLLNNGQVCWLGTRILAPRSRYAEIVDTISDLARSVTIGDPLDASTQMGPLVSAAQRDRVEGYIAKGRSEGGRLTAGGHRPKGFDRGWFLEPTVFADVNNNATIAREEIFGPVLAVIPYSDVDDAVRLANDSDFGLGGSVWTSDPERGEQVARRISSGSIGINGYSNEPNAPAGALRASGLGVKFGPEGLADYQNLKTVYLPRA
jgi:acyl-CoA reductase-like NAD-dependent aldehyde dehydrogenase